MAKHPKVIKVSAKEYDHLYPLYEMAKARKPLLTFQQWLQARKQPKKRR